MREVILCKYGEIALKGANRRYFEDLLCRTLERRLSGFGSFSIAREQSTLMITPDNDSCDLEQAYAAVKKVFGIAAVSRSIMTEKSMESILAALKEMAPVRLNTCSTFKIDARRSDKRFPLTSPQICEICGGAVLEMMPELRVDVHRPDVVIRVEIRDTAAYLHAGQEKGAGGMPLGSNGRGLLLLSGGIDSPVAGCMMAKRGVLIEAVHFESFPYTSERARAKVIALAEKMSEYCGDIRLHIISVTQIQEVLKRSCEEDYFTLLLRRFMMRLANITARETESSALITGESLGQVASQTMQALWVTDAAAEIPVFRPLIGMDKEEIIERARMLDTFETSILPYEDCCTVFTPRHPRTKPALWKVEREESKTDVDKLVKEAWETRYEIEVRR